MCGAPLIFCVTQHLSLRRQLPNVEWHLMKYLLQLDDAVLDNDGMSDDQLRGLLVRAIGNVVNPNNGRPMRLKTLIQPFKEEVAVEAAGAAV